MIKIEDGKIFYTNEIDKENIRIKNFEDTFRKFKIEKFTDALASKDPYPGGGAVAALFAAQGFGLMSMVCNLTMGKNKFMEFDEELLEIREDAISNMDRMLDLIQLDGTNFEPLAKAYSLPKSTEEEREYRKKIMSDATIQACLVPMEISKVSHNAIHILSRLKEISSILVISDVGVALECFINAIRSSMMNIYINLKVLPDSENKKAIQKFVEYIEEDYMQKYEEINNFVLEKIK